MSDIQKAAVILCVIFSPGAILFIYCAGGFSIFDRPEPMTMSPQALKESQERMQLKAMKDADERRAEQMLFDELQGKAFTAIQKVVVAPRGLRIADTSTKHISDGFVVSGRALTTNEFGENEAVIYDVKFSTSYRPITVRINGVTIDAR